MNHDLQRNHIPLNNFQTKIYSTPPKSFQQTYTFSMYIFLIFFLLFTELRPITLLTILYGDVNIHVRIEQTLLVIRMLTFCQQKE